MTSISPDLWKRIEPILTEALELEGEARSRYLERARARDKELVSQVELLLAADGSAEHLLSRPLSENDLTLFREALEQPGAATPVGS